MDSKKLEVPYVQTYKKLDNLDDNSDYFNSNLNVNPRQNSNIAVNGCYIEKINFNRNNENCNENSSQINVEEKVSKYQKCKSDFKQAIRPKISFNEESNCFVKNQFSDQKRLDFED